MATSAALGGTARAQDSLSKREAQYRAEPDLVHRAKLLAKLGPAEIDQALRDLGADHDGEALSVLERYRDEVRKTADQLSATHVNPVRNPAGFRELQIGLRESLRRFDDVLFKVPTDERPSFEAVQSDLTGMENSLIDALFPSPDEKHGKNGKKG